MSNKTAATDDVALRKGLSGTEAEARAVMGDFLTFPTFASTSQLLHAAADALEGKSENLDDLFGPVVAPAAVSVAVRRLLHDSLDVLWDAAAADPSFDSPGWFD